MTTSKFPSVDGYMAAQPEAARNVLEQVRSAIRKALPEAEETISYQIPAYKVGGRAVIYFAGWKRHYSLYPVSGPVAAKFADELAGYAVEKSTARFPLTEPVPVALIERIATFLAA